MSGGYEDLFNPKTRNEEFSPNMVFLAKNIYVTVLDEPGAGFYIRYDPISSMAEVGIPQANFLQMTQKWVEIKAQKMAESQKGVGPIG